MFRIIVCLALALDLLGLRDDVLGSLLLRLRSLIDFFGFVA